MWTDWAILNGFGENFLTKEAQIFCYFLGNLGWKSHHVFCKTPVATFRANIWKFGLLFIQTSDHTSAHTKSLPASLSLSFTNSYSLSLSLSLSLIHTQSQAKIKINGAYPSVLCLYPDQKFGFTLMKNLTAVKFFLQTWLMSGLGKLFWGKNVTPELEKVI